jgi:hypothetical protein
MSRRLTTVLACLGVALALGGCGERTSSARKSDASAVAGAAPAYTAPGWKAGDAASWEQHMRTRTQAQNEYVRTTANGH